MIRNTARTARKTHQCTRCFEYIVAGDRYLESVASPDHDGLGNTFWWRLAECRECAEMCGRGSLFLVESDH